MKIFKNLIRRIFCPWGKWELVEANNRLKVDTVKRISGYIYVSENIIVVVLYKRVNLFNGLVQYKNVKQY